MNRTRSLMFLLLPLIFIAACTRHSPKKPDATKGTVTGYVYCNDTGKPARFAKVILTAAPDKDSKLKSDQALPEAETLITGLDGRFRMEAVPPGHYFAYATLPGYLDPAKGIDFARIDAQASSDELKLQSALEEWKSHMVELTVVVGRTEEITIQIERGAEINGTVLFDDGSPAIGAHFQLLRKHKQGALTSVGLQLFSNFSIDTVSDSHGRYSITDLTPGEYTVCALLPADTQESAPHFCLGDVFRIKQAKIIKLTEGESITDVDITVPLEGLHDLAGTLTAQPDSHALAKKTLQLLYADDREVALTTTTDDDGDFWFDSLPEGSYILKIANIADDSTTASTETNAATTDHTLPSCLYADKEIPILLKEDIENLKVILPACAVKKPGQ